MCWTQLDVFGLFGRDLVIARVRCTPAFKTYKMQEYCIFESFVVSTVSCVIFTSRCYNERHNIMTPGSYARIQM